MHNHFTIQQLREKLQELSQKQERFGKEIQLLSEQVEQLSKNVQLDQEPSVLATEIVKEPEPKVIEQPLPQTKPEYEIPIEIRKYIRPKQKRKPSDIEKIIGESWISKVGILVLIIGVFLGAKYSIENDLINPLTRIVLGYISGVALLAFAIKLKAKYEAYSAVLVSGAMVIFYFITFFAYDFYGLIPQWLAFVLMVFFTIFTVLAALNYDKVVIAHIGLVGAYCVPFLLSSNSGRADILFSYIIIINTGILAVSVKKYWISLYYASFLLTWIIFSSWLFSKFATQADHYQVLALIFATIFFIQFYAVAIVNRIVENEVLTIPNVVLLCFNSFFYFAVGLYILNSREKTADFLGLFTLFNAVIHFLVGYWLHLKKIVDKTLFYLVIGLVFTFISIAIPIQLDGNWVTLLWTCLAVVLFIVGRTKNVVAYERISAVITCLSFISLYDDLTISHHIDTAFFNSVFMTFILVSLGYASILYVSMKKKYITAENKNDLSKITQVLVSVFLAISVYTGFYTEIKRCFDLWFEASRVQIVISPNEYWREYYNYAIHSFENVILICYTIIYFVALSFLNILRIKNYALGIVSILFLLIVLFVSQTNTLYELGKLRDAYIERADNPYFNINFGYVLVRYLLFACVAVAVIVLRKYAATDFMKSLFKKVGFWVEILMYALILSFLTNEFITWLALAGYQNTFKLALSILWGLYSLVLIYLGIVKGKKHLRIMAIVIIVITLLKLFSYDIAHLNTISKILVFIILGVLLLIASFLYNKFRDKISEDEKNN